MRVYIGILIPAGVYRSRHEGTSGMWDAKTGRAMFCAKMPFYGFSQISANICFDDRLSHPGRFRNDKLAAFCILREKWVACLPLLFSAGVDVCVDEQLVAFIGHCGLQPVACTDLLKGRGKKQKRGTYSTVSRLKRD